MISAGPPVRRLRFAALAVVAALSSTSPGSEDATSSELNVESPDVDPWQVTCLHPSDSARSADSERPLVAQAVDLWTWERRASRAFQSTYCDDCAMLEESAPTFFESSTNLLRRAAERFPTSATVTCALGMMHLRNASLGEGRLDERCDMRSVEPQTLTPTPHDTAATDWSPSPAPHRATAARASPARPTPPPSAAAR
jgi:hypothetical protein